MKVAKNSIRVGDLFENNDGCFAEVIEYTNWETIKIQFQDEYGFTKLVRSDYLIKGNFSNPYYKAVLGKGYLGDGWYKTKINGSRSKIYTRWVGIMTRGYSERYKLIKPTYRDCYVCDEWHNFQNFAKWLEKQTGFSQGYHVDKDLLVKGNKIYSPDTCVLLPVSVNNLLTSAKEVRGSNPVGVCFHKGKGKYNANLRVYNKLKHLGTFNTPEEAFYAYKAAKESYIKEVANKYKNQIDPRAYEALMNYEVNIDD